MSPQPNVLLIVNPAAGAGGAERAWPLIAAHLREKGFSFDSVLTESPGHAITLARKAVTDGYTTLVSVGGDGTLNEIVNGIFAVPEAQRRSVLVGVIPVGTGTDFVRTLGLPRTWQEGCAHLLAHETRLVDIGEMGYTGKQGQETRYFVNVAGLGFDGEVVSHTNYSSKKMGGTMPYLTNLVITLVTYQNKDVTVRVDDETVPGRMNSVIVANGQWFGGGMWISPNSRPDDGLFDVIIIGDVGKLELLQTMPRLYKGTHLTHPKLSSFRARAVHVTSEQEMWLQADGESLGRAPVSFCIHSEALRLIA
jgi:YegS/Rv2252/BmrU family lipid kinase